VDSHGNRTTFSFQDAILEMNKINSDRLRTIGYDARVRLLQVQLDDGNTLQYGGVGENNNYK